MGLFGDLLIQANKKGVQNQRALFVQKMLDAGLTLDQAQNLTAEVPGDFTKDHSEIYFDFGLKRWCRHLEPASFDQMLDDILQSAPSVEEGYQLIQNALQKKMQSIKK